MKKVKICECGHNNAPEAILCAECNEDISRISSQNIMESANPAEAETAPPPNEQEKYGDTVPAITFQLDNGGEFQATSGDIVGRSSVGADLLRDYPTVSREHLQVSFRDGQWQALCLSDNGVWHNGQFVDRDERLEIKFGDELKLSSKCRVRVF